MNLTFKKYLIKGLILYGGVSLTYKFLKELGQLFNCYIKGKKNLVQRYGQNSWALVTGASSGIGEGFCMELAKRQFNIILMARKKEELERIAGAIQSEYPNLQTKIILCDFTNILDANYRKTVFQQLEGLDISVLVNNAGIYQGFPQEFHKIDEQIVFDSVKVNCFSVLTLTHHLLPKLISREKKSAIINLSSVKSTRPFYYDSMYCSTKVFIDFFTRIITKEYADKIDILTLRPNYVRSNMVKKSPEIITVQPKVCANSTLNALGNAKITDGPLIHHIANKVIEYIIPDFLLIKFQMMTQNLVKRIQQQRMAEQQQKQQSQQKQ